VLPLSLSRETKSEKFACTESNLCELRESRDERSRSRDSAVMDSTIVMGGTLRSDWKNEATSENKKKVRRKREVAYLVSSSRWK